MREERVNMKYEKPVVLENTDIFEGVFAASGDPEHTMKWSGHDGGTHSEIEIHLMNTTGREVSGYDVTLTWKGAGTINYCVINEIGPVNVSGGNTFSFHVNGPFGNGNNKEVKITNITFSDPQFDPDQGKQPGDGGGWAYYNYDGGDAKNEFDIKVTPC